MTKAEFLEKVRAAYPHAGDYEGPIEEIMAGDVNVGDGLYTFLLNEADSIYDWFGGEEMDESSLMYQMHHALARAVGELSETGDNLLKGYADE